MGDDADNSGETAESDGAGDVDEVKLTLLGSSRLPDLAHQKLLDVLSEFGNDVIAEAGRLEARWRTDSAGEPEITSRDVTDAATISHRAPPTKKPDTRYRVLDATAFAAAFVGGVFGNNISTPVGAVGFAVCAFIGVVAFTNRGGD